MNHLKLLTISECFSSKINKNTVFLFHKLRNEVEDLSSYWGKKDKFNFFMKSHHIYIYLGGISYVREEKKVMHTLVTVSESVLLLTMNGTHGVKLVTVNGTFLCAVFSIETQPKGSNYCR